MQAAQAISLNEHKRIQKKMYGQQYRAANMERIRANDSVRNKKYREENVQRISIGNLGPGKQGDKGMISELCAAFWLPLATLFTETYRPLAPLT